MHDDDAARDSTAGGVAPSDEIAEPRRTAVASIDESSAPVIDTSSCDGFFVAAAGTFLF
jgi:hypothetical protein